MEPSWQPDPTGRHDYRWWDGEEWGDAVADRGAVSHDAYNPSAPTVSVITTPSAAAPAPVSEGIYGTVPKPRRIVGPIIAIVVVVFVALGGLGYLIFAGGDDDGVPLLAGESRGELVDEHSYVMREVELDDGDAIRYRVEGDPDRDLVTLFVAPDDLATQHALRFFKDYGGDVGLSDADELLSTFTEANDLVSDPDIHDAVLGLSVIQNSDRCCLGVPDTGRFVAVVPGTYRILVFEANGRPSQVRVIVERFSRQLFPYAEITEAMDEEQFFTDSGFFRETDAYESD